MSMCSITGCGGMLIARGYCTMHYQRWKAHGDPAVVKARPSCTFDGCGAPNEALGLCNKHYLRLRAHGNPATVLVKTGDEVGYFAVHQRLRTQFGNAKTHTCADCGGFAAEWAFDEPTGYSTDLGRYKPLCASCHRKADQNAHRSRMGEHV